MAFKFKFDESVQKGFRRIGRDQFEIALAELGSGAVAPVGVHACRKAMKRLRALVRLCAPALGKARARRHNAALRDIARLLSSRRDQAVLVQTLTKLKEASGPGGAAVLTPLERAWGAQAEKFSGALDPDIASRATLLLLKESKRFAAARFEHKGFEALRDGLEASYRHGRAALRKTRFEPSDETFHELRKAVQTHWRQMSLLIRAWPDVIQARAAAARELSQILGDDHDIAMLRAAADETDALTEDESEAIGRLCRNHQAGLRRATLAQADRLFAEKPGAFADRVAAYWQAAGILAFFESDEPADTVVPIAPEQPAAANGPEAAPIKAPHVPEVVQARSSAPALVAPKAEGKSSSQRRA